MRELVCIMNRRFSAIVLCYSTNLEFTVDSVIRMTVVDLFIACFGV